MGRDTRDSYDGERSGERGSNERSVPPGGRRGPSRPGSDPRAGMAGPPSRGGIPNRPSMPGASGASPSAPGGRRPSGPGSGFIRPPLSGDGRSGEGATPPRSDSSSRRAPGRDGGPPARYGEADYGDSGRSPARNGYDTPPNGGSSRRRSMADMARDVSRNMSRQLSAVMARTGRALRRDDRDDRDDRDYDSRYDSAQYAADRRPSPPPMDARRASQPDEITQKLGSTAYRRSRARMLARKWRLGRVRPNPIGYALGAAGILFLVVGVVLGGGAGGYYAYNYYSANVGKIQAVADLKYHANSVIYDRNGNPLYTVKGDDQYHIYVPLGQISELVQDATIDTEDRTFYTNSGVDLYSTVRAALVDARAGGAAQGASTITQQLVKLLVIKNSDKQLTRKLNEAILAYGVTAQYQKTQILEMYLNEISYGFPNQGIEAAAANYFGIQQITDANKNLTTANQQLQLWQAAVLAGVPNGPSIFKPNVYTCAKAPCTQAQWDNPFAGNPLTSNTPCGLPYVSNFYGSDTEDYWYNTHGHEWLVYCRTKLILDNMVKYGDPAKGTIYSPAQENDALAKLQDALEKQQIRKGVNTAVNGVTSDNLAPHFVNYVEDVLRNDFGIDHLESAGLKIYTTLDLKLNQYMQQRLHYYIDEPHADPWYGNCSQCDPLTIAANAHNGAGVAIDQHTGDILAMVGSVNYTDTSKQVQGNYNVAISKRSMGSATKPIVYATAFQMGWDPGIMLHDDVVCFPNPDDPKNINPDAPACKGQYVPHNDEPQYSGTFPIRYMLDNSLNIPATEAMSFVGSRRDVGDNFVSMAQRLGITTQTAAAIGPSTALGTQEMPLIELTSAYGTLANQGVHVPPRAVLEIEDTAGNVKWQAPANPYSYQAISPQAAYMVTNMMADKKARWSAFGFINPLQLDGAYSNLAVAAKTGTSSGDNGPLDITTLGYSPYLTLGLWLGNNNNDSMSNVIGIKGPGFVFHDVMMWAAKQYKWDPNAQFTVPDGLARAQFNCDTGLAPYKDSKSANLVCAPMKPSWLPASPDRFRNLYNGYTADMNGSPRPDEDLYWQNAPPLQS